VDLSLFGCICGVWPNMGREGRGLCRRRCAHAGDVRIRQLCVFGVVGCGARLVALVWVHMRDGYGRVSQLRVFDAVGKGACLVHIRLPYFDLVILNGNVSAFSVNKRPADNHFITTRGTFTPYSFKSHALHTCYNRHASCIILTQQAWIIILLWTS
jgi:hypothetical protein